MSSIFFSDVEVGFAIVHQHKLSFILLWSIDPCCLKCDPWTRSCPHLGGYSNVESQASPRLTESESAF